MGDYSGCPKSENPPPKSLSAKSLARVLKEYNQIQSDPDPFWCAYPINVEDPFDWHFTLKGPSESDFEGGYYHGRILLPPNYPFAPPTISLLTPNGRFRVDRKICLSISNYHPETWHPIWGIRTILTSLRLFFSTSDTISLNSLSETSQVKKVLAKASISWKCTICNKSNKELVNEMCPELSDESPQHSKNTPEILDLPKINLAEDIDTDSEGELTNLYDAPTPPGKLVEENSDHTNLNNEENLTNAYNRRLRPQHVPSSFFRQLYSKPSDNLDLILIAIDVLLGICLIVLINFLSHLILDISAIF